MFHQIVPTLDISEMGENKCFINFTSNHNL